VEATPEQDQLPRQEEAEKESREQPAEDEFPPIPPAAPHVLFDGGAGHSRRQSSSRYRRANGWNVLPEGKLTRPGGPL
jgi:hypothetical protein